MQAAGNRLPRAERHGRGDNKKAKPHVVTADDAGLLDALPIAAAVIAREENSRLALAAFNSRFHETVNQSSCTSLDWGDAECLKDGPIAELIQKFFDGTDVTGELDFRDGEGVAAKYFRLKLAPLPKKRGNSPRCLLSVVDRTVEVQAERTLRAEMLRDSLTGLPNRLAFSEAIEKPARR
jgi:hypothetical protein